MRVRTVRLIVLRAVWAWGITVVIRVVIVVVVVVVVRCAGGEAGREGDYANMARETVHRQHERRSLLQRRVASLHKSQSTRSSGRHAATARGWVSADADCALPTPPCRLRPGVQPHVRHDAGAEHR